MKTQAQIEAKARIDSKFWVVTWILCFILFAEIVMRAPAPAQASIPNIHDAIHNGINGWSLHDFEVFYAWQMATAFLIGMEFMGCLVLIGLAISALKDYYIIGKKESVN